MSSYPPFEYDPQRAAEPPRATPSASAADQPVTYPPPPNAYGQPGTMAPGYPPPPGYPPYAPYAPPPNPGYPVGYPAGYPGMPMYAPMMIGVPMYAPDPGAGQATTSMVLGIVGVTLSILSLSTFCAVINLTLGVVGIVMGMLGRRSTTRRGQAIAGLVLSIITVVLALGLGSLVFVLNLHRGY